MASTQFEATDARKAFPCFDEPSLKATFEIILNIDKQYTALSNMDVISEQIINNDNKDVKRIEFRKSPKMSTYLVAFAVGEFDYIEDYTTPQTTNDTNNNQYQEAKIKCRVYTTKGLTQQARFALDVATKTLSLFNQVFGIPYPLPKLDMLAVPDFDAGAMENWGLITYRTVYILYDEKKSAVKSKQRIASVIAHELAHQWFGNLVTMEWWSHLWLNEGFATWVGTFAVDKLFAEWDTWTQFFADDMNRGLQLDSLRSSHAIEVEVNEASEISQIFDAISYSKGASVIRMLSMYLGEDVFLEGIRFYLKKHVYKNASTKDLWSALSETSNKDVSKFMELWTTKIGYPLIEINDNNKDQIEIKQSRYLSSGTPTHEEDQTVWWVPLRYISGSLKNVDTIKVFNEVLDKKQTMLTLEDADDCFYKFNKDQTGFYRVKYPTSMIKTFGKIISDTNNTKTLTSLDKIGIVSDITSLSQSGQGKITDFLELLQYFSEERDYFVLNEISGSINKMLSVWFEEDEQIISKIKQLRLKVFGNMAHEIGWDIKENETQKNPLMPMLRSLCIVNAGLSHDEKIVKEARDRFDDYFINNNKQAINADVKAAIYSIIMKQGKEQDFEFVKKDYLENEIIDMKLIALSALGQTTNETLIKKALDFSISEQVRNQDIIHIISALGANTKSRRLAYDFVKMHWALFEERYSTNMAILGSLVKYTAANLVKENDAKDLEEFFKNKDTKHIKRALTQSLENIIANKQWLDRERENVKQWFEQNE